MNKKSIKILAIETSCDETAAAVISNCHPEWNEGSSEQGERAALPRFFADSQNDIPVILSSVVSSQIDLHAKTGGVVPEVASRAHCESIIPVISEALLQASKNQKSKIKNQKYSEHSVLGQFDQSISFLQKEIDYIAVTNGPGLIGSLLTGFNTAKALSYALDKPIIPVNHIEGHIYSAFSRVQEWIADQTDDERASGNNLAIEQFNHLTIEFPLIALTVSGGHTSLTLMKGHGEYQTIGQTLDDAAGEAFDKVAKLLELGYPGGPIVSKLASEYRNQKWTTNKTNHEKSVSFSGSYGLLSIPDREAVVFPRPILNDGTFNFSFSGLKTAVLTYVKRYTDNGLQITNNDKSKICCAFEDAVVDVLVTKTIRAAEKYQPKAIILAGGVAANKQLRESLESAVRHTKYDIRFYVPDIKLCGDNAAMIGLAAYYHIQRNNIADWNKISIDSNLEL